jgi:cation:H+ antiporter
LVLLTCGFALLIKGAGWLASGGSALGKRLGISDLVIGLTVVAFGTSMPELFVNVLSSLRGSTELAIGNVLGSNICNILPILGVGAVFRPLPLAKHSNIDIGVVVIATMLLFVSMFTGKRKIIDRWEGWLMLVGYCLYIVYLVHRG